MSNDELDEMCRRYRHADRRIRHCANPRCPGVTAEPLPTQLVDIEDAPDVTDELERVEQ